MEESEDQPTGSPRASLGRLALVAPVVAAVGLAVAAILISWLAGTLGDAFEKWVPWCGPVVVFAVAVVLLRGDRLRHPSTALVLVAVGVASQAAGLVLLYAVGSATYRQDSLAFDTLFMGWLCLPSLAVPALVSAGLALLRGPNRRRAALGGLAAVVWLVACAWAALSLLELT